MRKVKIEDIVNEFELITDDGNSFMSKATGEFFHFSDGELRFAKACIDEQGFILHSQSKNFIMAVGIFKSDKYIQLPTKDKINEYAMMMKYFSTLSDERILNEVKIATAECKGEFGKLRDIMLKYNIGDGWYKYKRQEFRRIAIDWCKRNIDEMPASIQKELKIKNRL